MGIFSKALAEYAPVDQTVAPDTLPNSLRRGWNSGLLGAEGQLHSVAGLAGEALGADEFAASRNADALRLNQQAAQAGPQVGKWDQVHGLRDMGNYAAGLIGSSAPVSLGAMGAAALTGGGFVPGMLAAGAATAPFEMGDVIQKQQADPAAMQQSAGTRLGSAALGGGASALFQGVVPGLVGKQLMGHGAAAAAKQSFKGVLGKNLVGDAALEGVAEGGGDVVKQYAANQNAPIDWESVKENAIGGAVAGGAMGGLGAAGDLTHRVAPQAGALLSSARTSINDRLEAARTSAGEKIDAAGASAPGVKVKSAFDSVSDLVAKGREKLDDTMDRMMNGAPVGVSDEEITQSTPERVKEFMAKSATESAAKAKEWGASMLDKMVDGDPRRQEVVDAMANAGERSGQMAMAGLKKAWDMGQATAGKVSEFASAVKAAHDGAKNRRARADVDVEARWADDPNGGFPQLGMSTTPPAGKPTMAERSAFMDERVAAGMSKRDASNAWEQSQVKKSEDYSGVHQVILQALQDNGLAKRRPDLFEPSSMGELAGGLRMVIEQITKGPLDPKVVNRLTGLLGEDTDGIINSLRRAIKSDLDPGEAEAYFGNVNALRDAQQSSDELNTQLKTLMAPENQKRYGSGYDLMEIADLGLAHARGELVSATDKNRRSAQALSAADIATNAKVRELFVQRFGDKADAAMDLIGKHATEKARADTSPAASHLDEDGDMVEAGDASFDEQGNRVEAPMQDVMRFGLTSPDAKGNSKSVLDGQAMEEGSRYAKQHLLDLKAKYPEHDVRFERAEGSTAGHIVVENRGNPGEFSDADLAGMAHDTKKYPNSPSRLKVGNMNIDAVKVARVMRDKGQDVGGGSGAPTTSTQRLVDGFKQGIAQLTAQFGKAIDVPDGAVIGSVGGKPLTWGAAQKLDPRTGDDKLRDSNAREQEKLRVAYAKAKKEGAAPEALAKLLDAYKELLDEHASVLDSELGSGDDIQTRSRSRTPAGKREARGNDQAVGATRVDNGTETEISKTLKPDKDGNIHEAATRLKGDALVHRANMDGSGHYVSSHADTRGALTNAAHELKAKTSKAQQALGNKLLSLLAPEVQVRMTDKDQTTLSRVLALKKPSERAAIVNPLVEKYGKPTKVSTADRFVSAAKEFAGENAGLQQAVNAQLKGTATKAQEALIDEAFSDAHSRIAKNEDPENLFTPSGATKPKAILADQIAKRQEYLNNPPVDYSTEKARGHLDWAAKQLERVNAEQAKVEATSDRGEQLGDYASSLKTLMKKAKSVLEGDASLADFEGGTPSPKALAAKKAALIEAASSGDKALLKELSTSTDAKSLQRALGVLPPGKALDAANARLSELVQDEDTAFGLQTKRYSLESTDDPRAKLITRLADDRRGAFADATPEGVYGGPGQAVSFGPARDAQGLYLLDSLGAHSFVIPAELLSAARQRLTEYPADRAADVLAIYAIQHALYDPASTKVQSFGPMPGAPAGRYLTEQGALGGTGEQFRGGIPMTRVEGVTDRQLARFLGDTLAYAKQVLGKGTLEVNWKRESGANKGKEGGGMFSAESTDPNTTHAPGSNPDIKTYLEKVLGHSVRLAWATFTHAGEFARIKGADIIRLSVHALNPMSTAYHESLHAFVAQLRDAGATDVTDVLFKAASAPHVVKYLNELYKAQPAVLAQLKDPEERAAYMYQAWVANPRAFMVGPNTRTVLQKISDLIRSVLGIWSNDQRALHILNHFSSGAYAKAMGTPNANRQAMMGQGRNKAVDTLQTFTKPLGKLAEALLSTGDARLRDTNIPALNELADLIKRHDTAEGQDQGFIPAARVEATKRLSAMAETLSKYTPDELQEALNALQSATPATTPQAAAAAAEIKGILRGTFRYMKAAGVKIGDLGQDYFPRVWDAHYVSKNEQALRDMLEPYVRSGQFKGNPTDFIRGLTSRDGNEFGIEASTPGMQFKKTRELEFLKPADVAPFLKKDLMGTLASYITQATRRAEWDRRMGWDDDAKDTKLGLLFAEAKRQGATEEHLKTAELYLKGVDGSLGDDINPHARRIMGNMIVYQNVRLLPMAVFSMAVDPLGVLVRGGDVREAYSTFKRGIASIPESFGRKTAQDEATRLAELVGVVDSAVLSHVMADIYTQGMVGGTAQKINNALFKYNMVEGMNRAFRVGASEAAMSFMARHADLLKSPHSRRWMAELGIEAGDIVKLPGGRIALTTAEGLSAAQVKRVHAAINQWVDGAMLRPDAADKPIWMNDPHYALISHLKQFVFAFQRVILGRVMHELKHGNYTPAMALASYVPMMIAADTLKGVIQGGGDTPEWKKNWDTADYVGYGVQRAGLFGVGQFGVDVAEDVGRGGTGFGALAGPTLEQLADAVQLMGGRKQFGPMMLDAMPANALYKESLGGSSDGGPTFTS